MKKWFKCVFAADPFDNNPMEIIRKVEGNRKFFKTVFESNPRKTFTYWRGTSTIDTLHEKEGWRSTIEEALDDLPLDVWLNIHEMNCSAEIATAVRNKLDAELESLRDWAFFALHVEKGEVGWGVTSKKKRRSKQ